MNTYLQPYPLIPQPVSEDGKLAALVRDMLGAKGLHEIMRGLLDALTVERRAELAASIITSQGLSAELAVVLRQAIAEALAPDIGRIAREAHERIAADVVAQIAKVEAEVTARLVADLTKRVTETVRADFRFEKRPAW